MARAEGLAFLQIRQSPRQTEQAQMSARREPQGLGGLQALGGGMEPTVVPVLHWVTSGDMRFDWALRVDTLTAVMLVVITSVSALVHLYSWGYMDEDPDQPRFFAYLSLFTFAMRALVTAAHFMQLLPNLRADICQSYATLLNVLHQIIQHSRHQ